MLGSLAPLALIAALATTSAAQTRKKQVKDQAELELYNRTLSDAVDPVKEIQDLDLWTQKYPDSDYQDDRLYLYLQASSKMDPPRAAAVLDYGARLMARDLHTVFNAPDGGLNILNVLFLVAWHAATLPEATADQVALGKRAAAELLAFAPKYFVAPNRPPNNTEEQWAAARSDIEMRVRAALTAMALTPGNQAMAKESPDCATAETAYTKALSEFPEDARISYSLGKALNCRGRAEADKAADFYSRAIYQFLRAAVVDPSLGIADFAAKFYTSYHGDEEGLEPLRVQVKAAPFPPPGFAIEAAAQAAARKHSEFAEKSPQIALWMKIREHLAAADGLQYFTGQVKDTDISGQNGARALRGQVVEGRPACRPKELLVAVGSASQPAPRVEIALRLDGALNGQAVLGEIEFDGVPRLFWIDPFLLTMDSSARRITGLKTEPCAAKK